MKMNLPAIEGNLLELGLDEVELASCKGGEVDLWYWFLAFGHVTQCLFDEDSVEDKVAHSSAKAALMSAPLSRDALLYVGTRIEICMRELPTIEDAGQMWLVRERVEDALVTLAEIATGHQGEAVRQYAQATLEVARDFIGDETEDAERAKRFLENPKDSAYVFEPEVHERIVLVPNARKLDKCWWRYLATELYEPDLLDAIDQEG